VSHKFNAAIQHRDDVSYVKLAGVIDEDNELANIVERIPRGTAVIDLGEIERINSCGVRDWVNWLTRLEGQGTRIILVECSPAIVAQINLVNNFTGNGVVKSFFVPYFCPECDEEKVLLVETVDMGAPPHEPPMCRCDECDLVMDFDDMPDSYFAFLSSSRRYAEADRVNGVIRELGPADHSEKVRVRSRVSSPAISPTQKAGVPSLAGRHPSQPNRAPMAPAYGASMSPGAPGMARPNSPTRPPLGQMGMSPMSPMSSAPPGLSVAPHGSSGTLGQGAPGQGMAPLGMGMGMGMGMGQSLPPLGQGMPGMGPAKRRGSPVIIVLVAVLGIAIAVLAYLLVTR
jgi:anti-anti-sigma regulatory factor